MYFVRAWNRNTSECHQNLFWQTKNILACNFFFRLAIQIFFGAQAPLLTCLWHLVHCYFVPCLSPSRGQVWFSQRFTTPCTDKMQVRYFTVWKTASKNFGQHKTAYKIRHYIIFWMLSRTLYILFCVHSRATVCQSHTSLHLISNQNKECYGCTIHVDHHEDLTAVETNWPQHITDYLLVVLWAMLVSTVGEYQKCCDNEYQHRLE